MAVPATAGATRPEREDHAGGPGRKAPRLRRGRAALRPGLSDPARPQIAADMAQAAGPAFRRFGGRAGCARRQGLAPVHLDIVLADEGGRRRNRAFVCTARIRLRCCRCGLGHEEGHSSDWAGRRLLGSASFCRRDLSGLVVGSARCGPHRFAAASGPAPGFGRIARLGVGPWHVVGLVPPLDGGLRRNGDGFLARSLLLGRRRGGPSLKELFGMLPGLGTRAGGLGCILPGRRRSRRGRSSLGRNRSRTPDLDEERLGGGLHSGMCNLGESWNAGSITSSGALGKLPVRAKDEISRDLSGRSSPPR